MRAFCETDTRGMIYEEAVARWSKVRGNSFLVVGKLRTASTTSERPVGQER